MEKSQKERQIVSLRAEIADLKIEKTNYQNEVEKLKGSIHRYKNQIDNNFAKAIRKHNSVISLKYKQKFLIDSIRVLRKELKKMEENKKSWQEDPQRLKAKKRIDQPVLQMQLL
ncbi:MAG: hypothetical protein H7321_07615 [Bacteroidia bacterium]|nr:hypothetical protein [Bacteroidia bacterium]